MQGSEDAKNGCAKDNIAAIPRSVAETVGQTAVHDTVWELPECLKIDVPQASIRLEGCHMLQAGE